MRTSYNSHAKVGGVSKKPHPVYTQPKYATKDAEIAALRNALTLIKSLSTPLNNLSWEASTQPHLPTLVDKISTIAKEAL